MSPELSTRAKMILREIPPHGIKTKEDLIKFHKKHNLLSVRNCGYRLANEILLYYGLKPTRENCPECKQKLGLKALDPYEIGDAITELHLGLTMEQKWKIAQLICKKFKR